MRGPLWEEGMGLRARKHGLSSTQGLGKGRRLNVGTELEVREGQQRALLRTAKSLAEVYGLDAHQQTS